MNDGVRVVLIIMFSLYMFLGIKQIKYCKENPINPERKGIKRFHYIKEKIEGYVLLLFGTFCTTWQALEIIN